MSIVNDSFVVSTSALKRMSSILLEFHPLAKKILNRDNSSTRKLI
jgi:hypothetical protein